MIHTSGSMHLHAARLLHESCSGYAGAEAVIEGDRRVACNFVSADREHLLLMPPSMADWLPEDRSGVVVPDVVAELDLSVFHAAYRLDGRGGAAYDPQMMLAVLIYAHGAGERSSRRIERRLIEDVAFGWSRRTSGAITSRSLGSERP
jgi:Transposase domain (DUF772)